MFTAREARAAYLLERRERSFRWELGWPRTRPCPPTPGYDTLADYDRERDRGTREWYLVSGDFDDEA